MISDLIFKGRLFGLIGKGEIPRFDAKTKSLCFSIKNTPAENIKDSWVLTENFREDPECAAYSSLFVISPHGKYYL